MKKSVRERLESLIYSYEHAIELLEHEEELAIEKCDFIAASKFQIKRIQLKHIVIDLKKLIKMNIELRPNASKLEQDADIIKWACKTYHESNKYNSSDYDVRTDELKNRITVRCAGRDPQPSDKAISYLKQHFVYNYDDIRDTCQGTIKYYEFTPRYSDNS